jgi:hypothetical protein
MPQKFVEHYVERGPDMPLLDNVPGEEIGKPVDASVAPREAKKENFQNLQTSLDLQPEEKSPDGHGLLRPDNAWDGLTNKNGGDRIH